jgi:hypothetical protein
VAFARLCVRGGKELGKGFSGKDQSGGRPDHLLRAGFEG